jgi:hypothetical protein
MIEQVDVAVTLYACIREVLDLNVGRISAILTVFVVFLSPSRTE